MLCAAPFTPLFWLCYIAAGASDLLDGFAARRLGRQTALGARLDSAADLVFACAVAATIIINVKLSARLWLFIAVIAALRFAGYAIGFYKYRAFSSLHTYANKAAGGMIFLLPALYVVLGIETAGSLLCVIAFVSAVEELLITIESPELKRDRKSIFER